MPNARRRFKVVIEYLPYSSKGQTAAKHHPDNKPECEIILDTNAMNRFIHEFNKTPDMKQFTASRVKKNEHHDEKNAITIAGGNINA